MSYHLINLDRLKRFYAKMVDLIDGRINTVNTRVDNIIAQSGTSSTEVVDARTAADGTTYTVIKGRLDAQDSVDATLTAGVEALEPVKLLGETIQTRVVGSYNPAHDSDVVCSFNPILDADDNARVIGNGIDDASAKAQALSPASSVPASATSEGDAGQYYLDSNYLYVCVATNTWKKVALTSL